MRVRKGLPWKIATTSPAVIFYFLEFTYILIQPRILNCNLPFPVVVAVSGEVSASGEVFTLEKVVFTMLMVCLLAISVAGCTSAEDESPCNANEAVSPAISGTLSVNETAIRTDNVTADQAKEIALTHAGLTKVEVTFVKAKIDTDDTGKNIFNQHYPIFQSFTSIPFFLNIFL